MAYETGSYATLEQLVTALKVFSEAHGWTTDEFSDFRGGKRLSHHNADGVYLHWYSANGIPVNANLRDTNGSYAGNAVTRIVMHPGTGYDAAKHPAWQPGVAAGTNSSAPSYYESTRMILNTRQIPVHGIYHFVAAPGLLAMFLDVGQAFFTHIAVARMVKLGGGDIDYIASAQQGSGVDIGDFNMNHIFETNGFPNAGYFSSSDSNVRLASGAWSHAIHNAEGMHVASRPNSPYVSFYAGCDFSHLMDRTQPSGVNGVSPLYPALYFKRVSGVLRPVGYLEHAASINARNLANGQSIQTTSGEWRVFNTYGVSSAIALRSDL